MEHIKDIARGLVIGVANIIPGVSGGTMALVLGIYERFITALNNISMNTIRSALGLLRFNRAGVDAFLAEARRIDAWFLGRIAVGAGIAIVALAKAMTFLLTRWHDPTYGFFFGLVLVSAAAPWMMIKKKGVACIAMVILAAGLLVGLNEAFSGDRLVEKARAKQELSLNQGGTQAPVSSQAPRLDGARAAHMFIMGALAISAMILPGISGSFVLLMLGGYFEILKAIATRDLPPLALFAAGCLAGMILFSRLLEVLLRRWHDQTLAFLVGLVMGSLWLIWPFKTTAAVGTETIYMNNRFPESLGFNETATLAAFFSGAVIVLLLLFIEKTAKNRQVP
jgi:putative membrane protein